MSPCRPDAHSPRRRHGGGFAFDETIRQTEDEVVVACLGSEPVCRGAGTEIHRTLHGINRTARDVEQRVEAPLFIAAACAGCAAGRPREVETRGTALGVASPATASTRPPQPLCVPEVRQRDVAGIEQVVVGRRADFLRIRAGALREFERDVISPSSP